MSAEHEAPHAFSFDIMLAEDGSGAALPLEPEAGEQVGGSSGAHRALRNHVRDLREMARRAVVIAAALEKGCEPLEQSSEDFMRTLAGQVNDPCLVNFAEFLYRARQRRSQFVPRDLLGEPGWDLLLDLFIQHSRGRVISTTSACIASGVPPTTALRWIGILEEKDFLIRTKGRDQRVSQIAMTSLGADTVREYLAAAWEGFWH